jgi:hypothetical protein
MNNLSIDSSDIYPFGPAFPTIGKLCDQSHVILADFWAFSDVGNLAGAGQAGRLAPVVPAVSPPFPGLRYAVKLGGRSKPAIEIDMILEMPASNQLLVVRGTGWHYRLHPTNCTSSLTKRPAMVRQLVNSKPIRSLERPYFQPLHTQKCEK